MNLQNNIRIATLTFFAMLAIAGCGVKGKPSAPLAMPAIGNGQPPKKSTAAIKSKNADKEAETSSSIDEDKK